MCEPSFDLAALRFAKAGHAATWVADLDTLRAFEPQFDRALSTDERQRAGRYRLARDRAWFVLRRGVLRAILGHVVGADPSSLLIEYSAHGKPSLAGQDPDVQFSLSHSSGLAMVAVTRERRVGIDIEAVRSVPEAAHIAARFFSPGERDAISSLPEGAQRRAFFDVWTRKEALVKAIGQGFAFPLRDVEVWWPPGGPARLTGIRLGPHTPTAWLVTGVPVGAGWSAALAIEESGC